MVALPLVLGMHLMQRTDTTHRPTDSLVMTSVEGVSGPTKALVPIP